MSDNEGMKGQVHALTLRVPKTESNLGGMLTRT